MHGWMDGGDWLLMILMMASWVALLVLVIFAAIRFFAQRDERRGHLTR